MSVASRIRPGRAGADRCRHAGDNGRLAADRTAGRAFDFSNRRDAGYCPLFPFGCGLTYASRAKVGRLDESKSRVAAGDQNALFVRGRIAAGARLDATGAVIPTRVDRRAQEDSLRLALSGSAEASAVIEQAMPIDLTRETNGQLSLLIDYRVGAKPSGPVTLSLAGGGKVASVPVAGALNAAAPGTWVQLAVPLRCFADGGADMARVSRPFVLTTAGRLTLDIPDFRIGSAPPGPVSCGTRWAQAAIARWLNARRVSSTSSAAAAPSSSA